MDERTLAAVTTETASHTFHMGMLYTLVGLLGTGLLGSILYIWSNKRSQDNSRFSKLESTIAKSQTDLALSISKVATALENVGQTFSMEVATLHGRITDNDKESLHWRAQMMEQMSKLCATCKERAITCPGRNKEWLSAFTTFQEFCKVNNIDKDNGNIISLLIC